MGPGEGASCASVPVEAQLSSLSSLVKEGVANFRAVIWQTFNFEVRAHTQVWPSIPLLTRRVTWVLGYWGVLIRVAQCRRDGKLFLHPALPLTFCVAVVSSLFRWGRRVRVACVGCVTTLSRASMG